MSKRINLPLAVALLAASLAACTAAAVTPSSDTPTPTTALAVMNTPTGTALPDTQAQATSAPTKPTIPAETPTTPTADPAPTYVCPIDSTVTTEDVASSSDLIRVAFIAENGIQLWDEEPDTVETIFEADNVTRLKFSDDGQRIVFERQLEGYRTSLWVVGADAQDARELLSPEALLAMNLSDTKDYGVNPRNVVWVPGTHKLAFSTYSFPPDGGYPDVFEELRVIDTETGSIEVLLDENEGGSYAYSPDGGAIALVSDTSVSLLRGDGAFIARDIVTYPALGMTDFYHHPAVTWDADSRFFTFAVINAVDGLDVAYNPDVTSTIWRVTVDGSATELATITGMATGPAFSPDLNQVAFMRVSPKGVPLREMHIADVYGAWDIVYGEGEQLTFWQWQPEDEAGEFIFLEQGKPFLGRLCQDPVPLQPQAEPKDFARRINWVDDQRYLFMLDDLTLHLGALDGSQRRVSKSLAEIRPGIRSLAVYDYYLAREAHN